MPFRRRLLIASLLAVLISLFVFWIGPTAVATGVRTWLWWQGRRQGLKVEIEKVDAPLLRPVLIQNLHIASANNAPCRIDVKVSEAIVDLQLARILTGASGRAIRALSIKELHVETHCSVSDGTEKSRLVWPTLQKLLPENLNVAKIDLRVESGSTIILLRNTSLSASQIEAGRLKVGELMIASPLFRQTFSNLNGATGWHDNRLTLGGVALARGLALQSMTMDLSHLGSQRVGIEVDFDTFGGKLRASVSNEWRHRHSVWSIAGSAAQASLAQTSEALGFTSPIEGLLHACKFTFHGDTRDLPHATASIWIELTDSSWAGRTSEIIMLGAALYNRQIQLQQLYVKQRDNQLTMSGEGALPSNSSDWLRPDFHGDISASIHDLGDFAGLFGAEPGDFAGQIAINGTLNARDRKLVGRLAASGKSLTIFKTPIDLLNVGLNLKAAELEIEQLELNRKKDFVHAQGKIDMSHGHDYSGTLSVSIGNLSDYLSIFGKFITVDSKPTPAEIQVTIDSGIWDARGIVNLPGSSPLNFTANFPLQIGADWNAFLISPLKLTLDFPSVFLANAPQYFRPEIFREGILSGKLSLSGTLQHPRIAGDLQLLSGKLANAPMNLIETNGRLTFNGDRASIDFLNLATKDVDLSFRGEIDLHDANDLSIKTVAVLPIFDLATQTIDCASRIEFTPVGLTLAPPVEELEFRGSLSKGDWSVNAKEGGATRVVRLCFGDSTGEKSLAFGAHSRPGPVQPRKRAKRR